MVVADGVWSFVHCLSETAVRFQPICLVMLALPVVVFIAMSNNDKETKCCPAQWPCLVNETITITNSIQP